MNSSPKDNLNKIGILFKYLSIFFFSTLFLIASIILYSINMQTFSLILSIIFIAGYFYLFLEFTTHYLIKANDFFKRSYKKHPLVLKIIIGIIFLGIVSVLIIYFFSFKKWCEIIGGTVLMALLIWVGKMLKIGYTKYIKKDKNDKTNK